MRTAKLMLVARVVVAPGLVGFGAYHATAQPVPPPREAKGTPPKPPPDPAPRVAENVGDTVPTAFQIITPPAGHSENPALWTAERAHADAWLVELVRFLKSFERLTEARVPNIDPPQAMNVATRHRSKIEGVWWKHRNPGPQP